MDRESGFTWKLGMFVTIGLAAFILAIYFIGKQQNLFGSTIQLNSRFKTVSGLKAGNNVRFSGINVGTVDEIELVNDSAVIVRFKIDAEVSRFIKTDAKATIGSDGLMGDRVLTISPGTESNKPVKDNDYITSMKAVELEDLMAGVKVSVDNASVITTELAQFAHSMNNGNGAISKLMKDEQFGNSLKNTITNLETFSKSLNNKKGVLAKLTSDEKLGKSMDTTINEMGETVKAAQNNFLLKGYFKKKKKAEAKKAKQAQREAKKEAKNDEKTVKDSIAKKPVVPAATPSTAVKSTP
jgi:phospholipid/cholesterol/gamma-HCH transport system substrate-binding protein